MGDDASYAIAGQAQQAILIELPGLRAHPTDVITVGKYWRRGADPRLVVMVLNNRDLNQVTWEQRVMEGDPKYVASQEIPDYPYARFAEGAGLDGIRVSRAAAPIAGLRFPRTRFRPTRPGPTARSSGMRRRSCWSRRRPPARPASATAMPLARPRS